jgi:hypothetical protein
LRLQVCGLGNKKGPEEGPGAPSEFGWHLAIPGGAPGCYYDNKEFGNNIAHFTADTSQRLRETYWPMAESQAASSYRAQLKV